jgi:maleate cis-trans isomerase
MEPHALALKAMGVETVALASYYGEELNNAIVDYLANFGLKTYVLGGFGEPGEGDALYTTSLSGLDNVSYFQVYQYCKSRLKKLGVSVDAIYINGAGWDAAPAVDYLEADLRVKVVLALGAEMWLAYEKLQIHNPVPNCGALLRDDYRPPVPV